MNQQALPGFDGHEKDAPPKVENPPFKYLEIEVSRSQTTNVFLKVPFEFDLNKIKRGHGKDSILAKACKETTSDSDWDDWGWENDIEWSSIKEVPEEEATLYQVYEVKQ